MTLDEHIIKSNDPFLVAKRLFIGNLPTDRCTQQDLIDLFSSCGKVVGVSIHKGYAFVQMDTETAAIEAINEHNKSVFKGNVLDIKRRSVSDDGGPPQRRRRPDEDLNMVPMYRRRDVGDIPQPIRHPGPAFPDNPPPFGHFGGPFRGPIEPPIPPMFMNDPFTGLQGVGPPPMPRMQNNGPPFSGPSGIPSGFEPMRDDFPLPTGPPQQQQQMAAPLPAADNQPKKTEYGVERPFDSVIVVTSRTLKRYAELVERRMLELNMAVDMIFLLNEQALNKAIDDMACRGVLYIIVIQQQHEEHKSITANIMHGTPQEHRNMPLEDALVMLARDFNAYLSSLRCGTEQPTMGFLLNLLADGKHLSVAELDRIITHLKDRRDRLIESEGGRKEAALSSASSNGTSALQQKILSIVNSALLTSGVTSSSTTSSGGQQSTAPSIALSNMANQFGLQLNSGQASGSEMGSKTSISLTDPNFLKTVDKLLQNPNIFRNLGQQQQPPLQSPQSMPVVSQQQQGVIPPPHSAPMVNPMLAIPIQSPQTFGMQ